MAQRRIIRSSGLAVFFILIWFYLTSSFQSLVQLTAAAAVLLTGGNEPFAPPAVMASTSSASNNITSYSSYQSWGPEGIDFQKVLCYINYTYDGTRRWKRGQRNYQPFPAYIAINNNNTPTMWIPDFHISRIATGSAEGSGKGAGDRLRAILPYFQKALDYQLFQNRDRFQALVSVLARFGSVPLIFDLADYRACQDPKATYTENEAIAEKSLDVPIFSLCRSPNCTYSFPIPTYKTYQYMRLGQQQDGSNSWQQVMNEWEVAFPWRSKKSQVFWIGACRKFRQEMIYSVWNTSVSTRSYFDIRTVGSCGIKDLIHREGALPQEFSMRYKAVIDIDGNSWSERLPRLLCYNSAVVLVAVEDDYDEYIMDELVPGVHYIPANLENLTEVARSIMQPENDDMLRSVVKNANTWCREHLTEEQLNIDFLSVLNGYVEMLNVRDPRWAEEWERVGSMYTRSPDAYRAAVPQGFVNRSFDLSRPLSRWNLSDYVLPPLPYTNHNFSAK
jgi:hypothetical protein